MKHILFLTWKDIKHPRKGGAEVVIYEYAKRLVADGYTVTWLGSGFEGGAESEIIDGIEVVRKYSINTIYFFAWKWYKEFIRNNPVDIIIDEAGGIPLLSPLYAKNTLIFFLIHHIGDEEYKKAFPFPLNYIFTRFVFWTFSRYKNLPTITVSDSTARELREYHNFKNISVVENATHMKPIESINWNIKKKEIVFLGRLTRMKRADHAIRAFQVLHKENPEYQLNIIGNAQDEEYAEELKILVSALNISDNVHFLGYSEEIVAEHLPRAELMLVTSTKEGYGLIVLEGNCYGLPVIAYDVPGLRDSVRDGTNGVLVTGGDYTAMGQKLIELTGSPKTLQAISQSSLSFIKDFGGWNERYSEFKEIILK